MVLATDVLSGFCLRMILWMWIQNWLESLESLLVTYSYYSVEAFGRLAPLSESKENLSSLLVRLHRQLTTTT
jgi:hypothetical protein